jgi:hypothetical protein
VRNFLQCVKNNDPQSLNAPITDGFFSAALSHLGNIATRVQSQLELIPETYAISNNATANSLLGREYRQGYALPKIG